MPQPPPSAQADRTVAAMSATAPTSTIALANPRALTTAMGQPAGRTREERSRLAEVTAVVAWLGVVATAIWWGRASIVDRGLGVGAAPLVGRWAWHPSARLIIPTLFAAAVVSSGPAVARRLTWWAVPPLAGLSASAWTLALAAGDGWARVTAPLTTRHEYEPFAAHIGGVHSFLRHFVEQLPGSPVHVKGHPPGAPLVPWALDALGLRGAGWFAALVILGWGVAVASVLMAARVVGGEATARRAAPALVILPAAVWAGTSADALFAGVACLGVALALTSRLPAVVAGGSVLGVGLLLTYGAVAVLAIAVVVAILRRRWLAAIVVAVVAVSVLVLVDLTTGFAWLEGLDATRRAYHDGIAGQRPAAYFALAGNPAALALAAGPAVAVGLVAVARRWREAASILPLVTVAVVVAVDASLLSKGEVERIWLPFVPWLALAAPGHRRWWLATQAALALMLQAWLRSSW